MSFGVPPNKDKYKTLLKWFNQGTYFFDDVGTLYTYVERHNLLHAKIPTVGSDGYCRVWLARNYTRYMFLFHRVVWIYYHGEIPEHLCINHKNGDKTDNRKENLELVTQSENVIHSYKNLGHKRVIGSLCGNSVLSEKDIPVIRNMLSSGVTHTEIAKKYNIGISTVHYIKYKKTWGHVKDRF
jgi:hypothetical protein